MYDGRESVISSEDMEPTTFDSMRKAAKAIHVSEGTLENRKGGFWCKLPLFDHFCRVPMQ